MKVSLIAAMDRAGLIGDGNRLPWHLPADLRRFKRLTIGRPVILGRQTFESIGRPLPGRTNIVLSTRPDFSPPGCSVARTLDEAWKLATESLDQSGGVEAFVIGGERVFRDSLPACRTAYLSIVEGTHPGSIYFPVDQFDQFAWTIAGPPSTHPADEQNEAAHQFLEVHRSLDSPALSPNAFRLEDWLRRSR